MVLDLAQRNEINLIISFKVKNFLYKYLCRNFSDEYIDIKFHVSIFLLSYLLQTKTPPKTKSWLRPCMVPYVFDSQESIGTIRFCLKLLSDAET